MSPHPVTPPQPADSSPYIRTYAKDIAAITGKDPSAIQLKQKQKFESKPKKFARPDEPLVVSKTPSSKPVDLSQLEKEAERIGLREQQESEADIELRIREGKNAPPSDILQSISLPRLRPGDILQQQPLSTPVTTLPSLADETPEKSSSPFHSYSSDFSDRIDQEHASAFSVLGAESDVVSRPAPAPKKRGLLPIIAGVVLIIAGAGAGLAAYHFLEQNTPVAATPAAPMLIIPDSKIELSGNGTSLMKALADVANRPIASDAVVWTYINESSTTRQGIIQVPADGLTFINALNLPAPDILLRNIDPLSMVGVINDGSQTAPFFVIREASYERTFAGMLEWEPTMAGDLSVLYPSYPAPAAPVSTTTASSTASTTPRTIARFIPTFIDEVVDNHNARVLKDARGNSILVYGYADEQTLIIARDEAAFTLLIGRLQANQQ